MKFTRLMALTALTVVANSAVLAEQSGKDVYGKVCATCHATGLAGAPRYGNAGDWGPRAAGGVAKLYQSALTGTAKGMPAKGGHMNLADTEVKAAVDYMLASVKEALKSAKPAETVLKKDEAKTSDARKSEPPKKDEPKAAAVQPPVAPVMPVGDAAAAGAAVAATAPADVNSFNRLLKPAGKRNLPPPEDGIHDPANDGTHALQPPLAAFGALPKSNAGNRVNWVEALNQKLLNPRYDRLDPKAEPIVMDLNIVREVKGSMPDVVYPHKQHTEWLDCSNCHPAIFVPQKGANAISMAAILLGEKCGVCHGKVAFPVSECRNCHSKKKDIASRATPAAAAK
jgi:c(7)-type cytochrome triheme protein